MEQNQQQPGQMQIKARDEEMRGAYSNMMQIVHTKEEFFLDFFLNAPPQGILASRVVVSPAHAKRIAAAMAENIRKYEDRFGKIEHSESNEEKIGFVK